MLSSRCTGVPLVLLLIAAAAFAAGTASVVPAGRAATVPEGQTDAVTIPQLINYQGKLTDAGGNPLNITTDMTFSIYDGLTQVWTETQTGVQVVEGIFNVLLGSVSAISSLPEAGNCSLEVIVGTEPMVPKIPLVTVPYAYHADNTGRLQGRAVSEAAPSPNQVLAWTGSAWAPTNDQTGSNYWTNSGSGYIYPNTPNNNTDVRIYGTGYSYGVFGATTASGGYGVYGYTSAQSSYGVCGYAPSASGYGVYGFGGYGSYSGYGVYGVGYQSGVGVFGLNTGTGSYSGYGVYGTTASAYSYGVCGYNSSTGCRGILAPAYYMLSQYIGVYGYNAQSYGYGAFGYNGASYGSGAYGYATGFSSYGVYGYNSYYSNIGILGCAAGGVYGYNTQSYGAGLYGYSAGTYGYGVYGYTSTSSSYGVYGYNSYFSSIGILGSYAGVYGYSGGNFGVYGYAPNGNGGYFTGGFGVWGNGSIVGGFFQNLSCYAYVANGPYGILSNGTKSCVIATSQGDRAMFCPEAPEVLFEDAGSAQLANGYCRVDLDPLMLEGCTIDDEHPLRVYVQLTSGDPVPTVVAKGRTWFEVRVADRSSNATFDWRILASRKGFEDKRLERVEFASVAAPAPTDAPPPAPVAPPAPSRQ